VFVEKEWSLCGRATWSDFAIAYTPPEQGDSAFHAVQRATTRHGFGKDPNGRREEAFSNKRLLAATDLRLRATERIGDAHSRGNLVMGELVSNDRREVRVWDHLSAWGYRVERNLTYDDYLGWMSQNGTYATRASFMALAAEATRPLVLLRVHRLQTVTTEEAITDLEVYNPRGMGGLTDDSPIWLVMDESEHCCMLRAPRGSLQQLLVPNTDVPTPEGGGMDQKVIRHDRPPGKRHQRGAELRMQEPEGKETTDWQVIPPKTVKFVCLMGTAPAPVVPVPTVDTPTAMEHAKTDTIYRVLYSPDEAEEVTTAAQVSDAQAAPRVAGTAKKRKPIRPEAMVIPAFGDLESKRKEGEGTASQEGDEGSTLGNDRLDYDLARHCGALQSSGG
jgi:hypothetical protein